MGNTNTDRLALEITATDKGASSVVRGFSATTTAELRKVEGAAGTAGAAAGTEFGTSFGTTALAGLQALGAAAAGFRLFGFGKEAFADAIAVARAEAQLGAQIQATGNLAGTSVAGIDAHAQAIEATQAIYSGTVKQGAALLLTFQEIRNEPGPGGHIFDRTLNVAAAVSNIFHKEMPAAITQIGRALENPQAGMQALSRSGLTLERSDRIRILNLAKQGDLLGAQKALLDALESRTLAAGAAAAKADPLQRFGVALQKFKVGIGDDLAGPGRVALTVIEDIEHAFTALPAPIRVTTEALVGVAAVALPLLKVKSIVDSLSALSAASAAQGAGAAAGAIGAEAAAAGEASAATAALNVELSTLGPEAFSAEASFAAFNATLAATQAEELATAGTTGTLKGALATVAPGIGFGGALGAAAAGFAAFTITYTGLKALVGGHDTPFAQLSTDTNRLAQDINDLTDQSNVEHVFSGFNKGLQQDARDLKDLNAGFISIADTQGASAATKAIGNFIQKQEALGVSGSHLGHFLGPALDQIAALATAEENAAQATGDLNDDFHRLTAGAADVTSGYLAVADAIDAVHSAEQKVKDDQADIAGTSDKAKAAIRAEQDAYRGLLDAAASVEDANQRLSDSYRRLRDSQERVADSAHTLLEAQQALDKYNSPRGAEERALQLDIIQRRVVTTPAEADQKRLDLLKFADDNAERQQSLQDSLTSAQRGYRDALESVADANRGIIDAQKGVADSTRKVQDAEDKLRESIDKQQRVSKDGAAQLTADKRKLEEAILAAEGKIDDLTEKTYLSNREIDRWVKGLKDVADEYAPGSRLDKNIDALFGKLADYRDDTGLVLTGNPADQYRTPGASASLGSRGRSSAPSGSATPSGVTVNQTNHFNGGAPTRADLEHANRELGWRLSRSGRN